MARLEDLTEGMSVRGVMPGGIVTVVNVRWYGNAAVELTYKDAAGNVGSQLLYRDAESGLEIVEAGKPWSFDGDGELMRLVSEAYRIRLAHLFDPMLAVHTSIVEPLPHQITAVYGEMLPRQPLRFLLADDPGAGKTIMTGLFIKELLMRGDVHRCLIVCPGSLVEQWQDELDTKFHLHFGIISHETIEASRSGNPFAEHNLVIARLDHLARNDELQARLQGTEWDLIVVDEAHKMSASYFNGEIKKTKRYRLGEMLGDITRNLLLLTATPHNGKDADFALFMSLLDPDRFEGKEHDSRTPTEAGDLMRRLVKEQLVKFDGRPLFPERIATTVNYTLSPAEADLYGEVTRYVSEEMNRADRLRHEGEGRRGNTVGFALTILQRRLASSPEAIYRSLQRRHERLKKRLQEEGRGGDRVEPSALEEDPLRTIREAPAPYLDDEDLDDLDDAPEAEVERLEEQVVDRATAARTVEELRKEIASLARLERMAFEVRQSGDDRKWEELSRILQDESAMATRSRGYAAGNSRKLIIFTENRDTLSYLRDRITTLLGNPEAVVTIHGGLSREARRQAQEEFTQNEDVLILIATDAAGEGVNLQRAHLMVNYDLPWNPNRLEQRFGRIHRIGQTEVCHLWNLVAGETREGEVFQRLFAKLEREREALGGQVFDVLGKVFTEKPLRELLMEAIRYGDRPEVKARLEQVIDEALDRAHLQMLLEERALARDAMDARTVLAIREQMERAEARRLQPHYIASFFLEAFQRLGGSIREREPNRYQISSIPAAVRQRAGLLGTGLPLPRKYERITFEKDLITVHGKPLAEFVCPGHPLLDAVIELVLERHSELLKRGAVLIDPDDPGTEPRALVYLEHSIGDGRVDRSGRRQSISRQLEFVELGPDGSARPAGFAPYLDYRPLQPGDQLAPSIDPAAPWLGERLEGRAVTYAIEHLVPRHLEEVRELREERIDATIRAVKQRLMKEVHYWDGKAQDLQKKEKEGKQPRMNSMAARRHADELEERMKARLAELENERHIVPLPPVVIGGALVVPAGALVPESPLTPNPSPSGGEGSVDAAARAEVERVAMEAVMEAERRLGRIPRDVSKENCGYDIESAVPGEGKLVMLEVKGRQEGSRTVTITRNEVLTALNRPKDWVLALVEVDGTAHEPRYVRKYPFREPSFAEVSVNLDLKDLLERAGEPS